jgi:hypothetical protein
MRLLSTITALAAFAAAGAALAQPAPGAGPGPGGPGSAVRAACAADMQKFCADTQPGPARGQCMQSHQNDLSAECKAAIAQMRAMMQQNGGGPPPSSAPPGK